MLPARGVRWTPVASARWAGRAAWSARELALPDALAPAAGLPPAVAWATAPPTASTPAAVAATTVRRIRMRASPSFCPRERI